MSKLTEFLLHEGTNAAGLHFSDVMYLRTADFELTHDFIQWIFPLPEPSRMIASAPVLTQEDYDVLQAGLYPLDRLVMAKDRFLVFLEEYSSWMVDSDHNHARITRALKCLSLFRGMKYAMRFSDEVYRLLAKANKDVSSTSKKFWREALDYRETQGFIQWK